MKQTIQENLNEIRSQIQICSPHPDKVRLVAVSKRQPIEKIIAAVDAGAVALGENRIQDAIPKLDAHPFPGVERHFIGYLQSNKLSKCLTYFDWLHSLQSVNLVKRIHEKESDINCLIEVNISGDSSKSGLSPDNLKQFVRDVQSYPKCRIRGLMGMASFTDDPNDIRKSFRLLKELALDLAPMETETMNFSELSMGMSNDYKIALEEGATMIRVGTGIFGQRQT